MAERIIDGRVGFDPIEFDPNTNRDIIFLLDYSNRTKLELNVGFVSAGCELKKDEKVIARADNLLKNPHLIPPKTKSNQAVMAAIFMADSNVVLDINSTTCQECPFGGKHIGGEGFRCPSFNPKLKGRTTFVDRVRQFLGIK